MKRLTATTAAGKAAVIAVSLGAVAVVGTTMAHGASGPVAPNISSGPAIQTNSTSATFVFSGTGSLSFRCSRDGAAFVTCASGTTYTGFAAGAHAFQVTGVDNKGKSGGTASYSWTVDLTAPTLTAAEITRLDSSPTKVSPLRWTVSFTEPVSGVLASSFGLTTSNTAGTPVVSSAVPVTSSPSTAWIVSAATTGVTGSDSGSIALKLQSGAGIKDSATNALVAAVPVTGEAYAFDTTPPAAATITAGPAASPALTASTSASFSFSLEGESGASFLCKLDGGSFASCTSPQSYSGLTQGAHTFSAAGVDAAGNQGLGVIRGWTVDTVPPTTPILDQTPADPSPMAQVEFRFHAGNPTADTARFECQTENQASWATCASPYTFTVDTHDNGQHAFSVRAVDAAGNTSMSAGYKWKTDPGVQFVLSGNPIGLLYPGVTRDLAVTVTNSKNFAINVVALAVSVSSSPAVCPSAGNLQLTQAVGISSTTPVNVPANSSIPIPAAQRPKITLLNTSSNQDACKNVSFGLHFDGTAVK